MPSTFSTKGCENAVHDHTAKEIQNDNEQGRAPPTVQDHYERHDSWVWRARIKVPTMLLRCTTPGVSSDAAVQPVRAHDRGADRGCCAVQGTRLCWAALGADETGGHRSSWGAGETAAFPDLAVCPWTRILRSSTNGSCSCTRRA